MDVVSLASLKCFSRTVLKLNVCRFNQHRVFLNVEDACLVAHVFRVTCFRSARQESFLASENKELWNRLTGVQVCVI